MINIRLELKNVIKSMHSGVVDFRMEYGFNIFNDSAHQWIYFHNEICAN